MKAMRIIIICLLLVISVPGAFAQSSFYAELDYPNNEWVCDIEALPDTTYLIASIIDVTDPVNVYYDSLVVTKLDSTGSVLWRTVISEGALSSAGSSILSSSTGEIYLVSEHPDYDIGLSKFSSNGNLLWSKRIYRNGGGMIKCDILETTDNDFIISGDYSSVPAVLKIDSSGNVLWSTITISPLINTTGNGINAKNTVVHTLDSSLIICGSSSRGGPGQGNYNGRLFKTDSLGTVLWHRSIGGTESDMLKDVLASNDSGCVILGYSDSYGAYRADILLAKYDKDGTFEWAKVYDFGEDDDGMDFLNTDDNGFFICGNRNHINAWPQNPAGIIMKTDSMGNVEWSYILEGNYNLRCMSRSADGAYMVAGHLYYAGSNTINPVILKVNEDGYLSCHSQFIETEGVSVTLNDDDQFDYVTHVYNTEVRSPLHYPDLNTKETIICQQDYDQLYVYGEPFICSGDSVTLTAINDTQYSWAESTSPSVIIGTSSQITVAPTTTTTYYCYGSSDTFEIQVYVKNCSTATIVEPGQKTITIKGFPNPTSGQFTIELGQSYSNITIVQHNLLGQVVKEQQFKSTDRIETFVEGEPGVYQFEIYVDDERKVTVSVLKE